MRRGLLTILILLLMIPAGAQRRLAASFQEACDSLSVLLTERTSVHAELRIKSVSKRGKSLDFHFTGSLGEVPWRKGDINWFRKTLQSLFPASYRGYSVGKLFCKTQPIDELVVAEAGSDGTPPTTVHKEKIPGAGRSFPGITGRISRKGSAAGTLPSGRAMAGIMKRPSGDGNGSALRLI